MIVQAIGAVLLAAMSAFVTYLGVRRKTSGSVDTSEASALWAESQSMRRELRDEAVELRAEVATLRREGEELRGSMATLQMEITQLRDENRRLRSRVETLNARLGDPNRRHNQRVDDPADD